MPTEHTASDITRCIVNLNLLHHALRGDLDLTIADAERIIKDAQEALLNYQNFLLYLDRITAAMVEANEKSENPIFHKRVYEESLFEKRGSDNENRD